MDNLPVQNKRYADAMDRLALAVDDHAAEIEAARYSAMMQCADIANGVASEHDASDPRRASGAALVSLAILKAVDGRGGK